MKLLNKINSVTGTPKVVGDKSYYVNNIFGFYCKTPLSSAEPELMFYHNYANGLDFIKVESTDGTFIFKECNTNKMYQVQNGNKTAYKNNELIKQIKTVQLDNYSRLVNGDGYIFTENSTGKTIEFARTRHNLQTERNGYFYFRKNSKPKQLLRLNEHFETLASYDFEGQGVGPIKVVDQFAFYAYKGTPNYLEVFDLDNFCTVSEKIIVEGTSVRVYKIDNCYYIHSGFHLFVWDGISLHKQDFGNNTKVLYVCAKTDYLYVIFEQDPYVYAYKAETLTLLNKHRICNDAYLPSNLYDFGNYTRCEFELKEPEKHLQLNYTAAWNNDDFFSDQTFDVVMETPIYTETKITEGELFSVKLVIDASQPLETVIRQSIAIAGDAITRHGDMGLDCVEATLTDDDTYSATGKYFSPHFNGKIYVCYQGGNFSEERQEQFQQAIIDLNNYYNIFNAYALGKINIIDLLVSFE